MRKGNVEDSAAAGRIAIRAMKPVCMSSLRAVLSVVGTALPVAFAIAVSGLRPVAADDLRPVFTIEREELERHGIADAIDLLARGSGNFHGIGRAAILDTFTSVFLVNGRPVPNVAISYALESIPVSAIERIEILPGSHIATVGDNAFTGAVNIVLRSDFKGTEIRTGLIRPRLKGGDAEHASLLWGGSLGSGHLMLGVDRIRRQEILDADRDYSRALYNRDGPTEFSETVGVSYLGNTAFYIDGGNLASAALGDCDGGGYVRILNPRGATGDGCGFAYADISWQTNRFERDSVLVNFDHPLGEDSEIYLEARHARAMSLFRFAPSPDALAFPNDPNDPNAFNSIRDWLQSNKSIDISSSPFVLLGHRFVGHGNRDWGWDIRDRDVTLGMRGTFTDGIDYDAYIREYSQKVHEIGNTFVNESKIRELISSGEYDVINPLSPENADAIEESGVQGNRIASSRRRYAGLVLSGNAGPILARRMDWRMGFEAEDRSLYNKFRYRDSSDNQIEESDVLGTGGRPVDGQRKRRSGFSEITVPVTDRWDVRIAGRLDDFSDAGTAGNNDISTRYRLNDRTMLRASFSRGQAVPNLYVMYADPSTYYPYVSIPGAGRSQVKRTIAGNPNLRPYRFKTLNLGLTSKFGPFDVNLDRFTIEQSGRPSTLSTQSIINLHFSGASLPAGVEVKNPGSPSIEVVGPWVNIQSVKTSGIDLRLHTEWTAGAIDYSFDTSWLRITDAKRGAFGRLSKSPLVSRDRIHATVNASRGDLTASWNVQHNSKFKSSIVDDYYPSWTGHDISLTWRNALSVRGLAVTGGVLNVTDEGPATVPSSPDLTAGSYDARLGRSFYLTTRLSW